MEAVSSFSSVICTEPDKSVTIKKIDKKLSRLEKLVDELSKLIFSTKQALVWREEKVFVPYNVLIGKCSDLYALLTGDRGIYSDIACSTNASQLFGRICRIRELEATLLNLDKSMTIVYRLEQENLLQRYQTLGRMVDTLFTVLDPNKSVDDKIAVLELKFAENNLDIAEQSPRDVGIELLKLFKIAIKKTALEHKDAPPATLEKLFEMRRVVKERITSIELNSPRLEKDSPRYPEITQENIQQFLKEVSTCKNKYLFWEKLSYWTRIVSYVKKLPDNEAFGVALENNEALQITGLGLRLQQKLQMIVNGEISPKDASELSRELRLCSNTYMHLKATLEQTRKRIYKLVPDSTFKTLLVYAYGLRQELSEIGFLLETVVDLSGPEILSVFTLQAALKAHLEVKKSAFSKDKQFIESATTLFHVGMLLRENRSVIHSSKYAVLLKRTLLSVKSIYTVCLAELLQKNDQELLLWNLLFTGKTSKKKFDVYFLEQMLGAISYQQGKFVLSQDLLLLEVCRRTSSLDQNILNEFDRINREAQLTELLDDAYKVVSAIMALYSSKKNIRAYAQAVQLYKEFEKAPYAQGAVHASCKKMLYAKFCELAIRDGYPYFGTTMNNSAVLLFEMLACCLFGKSPKDKAEAQEHVLSVCEKTTIECSEDVWVLLYENTMDKLISSSNSVTNTELLCLIAGPIAAFINNGKSSYNEAKIQQVINWLIAHEADLPEENRITTQLYDKSKK